MSHGHTVRSFDEELGKLQRTILNMGREVNSQLGSAVEALTSRDGSLAQRIIRNDAKVNALEHEADALTIRMLALRQPMAVDLRSIIASLKIATDLERVADYASNIAKNIDDLNRVSPDDSIEMIVLMAKYAQEMLRDVLKAYNELDVERAVAVWHRDRDIDEVYAEFLRRLRDSMKQEPGRIEAYTSLIFVARSVERIGDHLTNIAEHVHFLVRGEMYAGAAGIRPEECDMPGC